MIKNMKFLTFTALIALSFSASQVYVVQAVEQTVASDIVEKIYSSSVTYSSGNLKSHQKGLHTHVTHGNSTPEPQSQRILVYKDNPKSSPTEERKLKQEKETILKLVIEGKDGRERIANPGLWPYSALTQITIQFGSDIYGGSGSFVGPHHVLTCGHNVYDIDAGEWAENITVYPGLNDGIAPFGKGTVVKDYAFKEYVKSSNKEYDMALLLLDKPMGKYTGWCGLLSTSDEPTLKQQKVQITGYPGDGEKALKQMWTMSHGIDKLMPEEFDYIIDTYGGQSGSPIWIDEWGTPMIIGVHTLGSNTKNSGVRLSKKKFDNLISKLNETYILTNTLPVSPRVPVSGSLFRTVFVISATQSLDFELKRNILAKREETINESIDQISALTSADLTCGQFKTIFNKLYPLYNKRRNDYKIMGIIDSACESLFNTWVMKDGYGHGVEWFATLESRYDLDREIASLGSADLIHHYRKDLEHHLQDDVSKTMALHQELYEKPHGRWDELNKKLRLVPLVAQGYEQIYQRFMNGRLIYKPNLDSDIGQVELPISDLSNPLEGTFDLSNCGDSWQFLSISTGYRKGVNSDNMGKIEIWLTPRFLVEKNIDGNASHLKQWDDHYKRFYPFPDVWPNTALFGILWNYGGWSEMKQYDYLTQNNMDALSDSDLSQKWLGSQAPMQIQKNSDFKTHVYYWQFFRFQF